MGWRDKWKAPTLGGDLKNDAVDSMSLKREAPPSYQNFQRTGTTPYLGLYARLSQVWFNRWTVLLILVLVRVLILLASLDDNLGDAKTKALSACTKVEDVGSAMASMPHYLSVGVNRLAASGITEAVHGMMQVLDMILTGVQELILFVINMMTATYTCLLAVAVHGGLNVSAEVVTKTTDAMNTGIDDVASGISSVVSGIQTTINDAFSAASIFGAKAPTIDLTDELNKLKSVHIDSSGFVADLNKLNDEIPTFADVQNLTETAVAFPFNLVKEALNKTYGAWTFNDSVFPVASKEALTFCSDNSVITDFFEALYEIARKAKIGFIVVLVILAILICIPMAWWEIRSWRHQREYRDLFVANKYDERDMMFMSSRPFTSKIAIKISCWMAGKDSHEVLTDERDRRRETMIRWAVAYGSSLPALFVLSLAIAGFFSCLCQYIILAGIEKEVPALESQVSGFADEVVSTLDRISVNWANDANSVITKHTDEINNDVLSYVVNATDAVNNTINLFISEMDKALTTVFNGTVLMDPVKGVVYCMIGMKIETVQKGITWVHDHAHVSFPLFPNDTFSAGAAKSIDGDSNLTSFLAAPGSVTSDEITDAVDHVTTIIHNGIVQEALISLGLFLVYILVVLVGIIRMLVGMTGFTYEPRGSQVDPYTTSPTNASHLPPGSLAVRSASEAPMYRRKEVGSGNPFADPPTEMTSAAHNKYPWDEKPRR
jgi:hypothetical protein